MKRWSLGVSACAALVLVSSAASAAPVEVCVSAANEAAQLRTDETKLTKALEQSRICAAEDCPAMIRDDCRKTLAELTASVPSVVLVAEVADGEGIFDVSVTVDGRPLVKELDGRPIELDPGLHVFVFQRQGDAPVEVRSIVRAGQKSAEVRARFPRKQEANPEPSALGRPVPTSPSPTPTSSPDPAPSSSVLPTVGLVVVGAGVAGLGLGALFGLSASRKQSDAKCPGNVCDPTQGGDPDKLRDAQASGNLSTVFFVAGGALAVGGLVLYFVAPKGAKASGTSARLRPSVGPSSAAIVFDGLLF